MILFTEAKPPELSPLISIVIEQKVEEPTQESVETPKEYTIEEKVKLNVNNCNTDTQYIRADNAECLDKPVQSTTSAKKPARVAENGSNSYSYGYCTWYVKNSLGWVPNGWGNANQWAYNARSDGYTVSNTPVVGAVAQTSGGALGHVAVVTSVNDGTVTISEMNYSGWNRVSTRTAPISDFVYIY